MSHCREEEVVEVGGEGEEEEVTEVEEGELTPLKVEVVKLFFVVFQSRLPGIMEGS